jgi:hypothetical protein
MNRRQLFRNTLGLMGAATVAPSLLTEALPVSRVGVEVLEDGYRWTAISGLDAIRAGQLFRFILPTTLDHIPILEGVENSWFGVAAEDGKMMLNDASEWVGGAVIDHFDNLDDAVEFCGVAL